MSRRPYHAAVHEGPLSGIVVVDLTRVLAGPYCTLVLSDLGARIIKVERPGLGDDARHIGPFHERSVGLLRLHQPGQGVDRPRSEGRRRPGASSRPCSTGPTSLVENFRPGTMADLGYAWDDVHRRWPRLIQASLSGFGQTGPMSDRPAYDMVVQALGGVMSITGPDGGEPTRVGTSIGDITAGLFGVIGILAALHDRARTGQGALVDVAMLDCQVAILENAIARYVTTGVVPGPIGARHPSITPFGAVPCRRRRTSCWPPATTPSSPACARCSACPSWPTTSGSPPTTPAATTSPRCEPRWRRRWPPATVAEWLARMEAHDLPAAPINDVAAVLAHPQVRARNMVVPVDDPAMPGFIVAGNPVKLSTQVDPAARPAAPALGADRARLLAELGLSPDVEGVVTP